MRHLTSIAQAGNRLVHLAAGFVPNITPVNPASCGSTPGCLPGLNRASSLVSSLMTYAELFCFLGIAIGAIMWIVSYRRGNFRGSHEGQLMVIASIIGAILIGGSSTLLGWGFNLGI